MGVYANRNAHNLFILRNERGKKAQKSEKTYIFFSLEAVYDKCDPGQINKKEGTTMSKRFVLTIELAIEMEAGETFDQAKERLEKMLYEDDKEIEVKGERKIIE